MVGGKIQLAAVPGDVVDLHDLARFGPEEVGPDDATVGQLDRGLADRPRQPGTSTARSKRSSRSDPTARSDAGRAARTRAKRGAALAAAATETPACRLKRRVGGELLVQQLLDDRLERLVAQDGGQVERCPWRAGEPDPVVALDDVARLQGATVHDGPWHHQVAPTGDRDLGRGRDRASADPTTGRLTWN